MHDTPPPRPQSHTCTTSAVYLHPRPPAPPLPLHPPGRGARLYHTVRAWHLLPARHPRLAGVQVHGEDLHPEHVQGALAGLPALK